MSLKCPSSPPPLSTLFPLLTTTTKISESLSESPSFPSRELASLVASKVYYHLQNLDEALSFALGAGKLFSLEGEEGGEDEEEFVETVVCEFSSSLFSLFLFLFLFPTFLLM